MGGNTQCTASKLKNTKPITFIRPSSNVVLRAQNWALLS